MSDSWKLSLPCTRAEADAIAARETDLPAVLVTSEVDEAAGVWRLDAYFDGEPEPETVAAIRELAATSGWSTAAPERLAEEDWLTMSQAGLEPIREGRFVVHTSARPADPPPGGRAFVIDAGRAFGTGHHATTAGCLTLLDSLGERAFTNVIDLGTGSGLLACAARHLWPKARVTATDIDAVAIDVARRNMALNGMIGIDLIVADGARDVAIEGNAPYDLIIANILAEPLIAMAADIAAVAAPGATIVLAGLLSTQADAVIAAYAKCGCTETARDVRGDWTILRLAAPVERVTAATRGVRTAAEHGSDAPPSRGTIMARRNSRAVLRVAARVLVGIAALLACYGVAALIGGAIPANANWRPPASGVTIYVETNGVHTGIVVPKVAAGVDWRGLLRPEHLADPRYAAYDHAAFGWGERAVYLETPTWADVKPFTVLRAALGSDRTLVHVDHIPRPRTGDDVRALVLRPAEYRRLVAYLRASFADRPGHIRGYAGHDVFYEARGRYDAIRTCNAWTGDALRYAGVRVGAWTPFAWSVMAWF